jgi:hypothetical protein
MEGHEGRQPLPRFSKQFIADTVQITLDALLWGEINIQFSSYASFLTRSRIATV